MAKEIICNESYVKNAVKAVSAFTGNENTTLSSLYPAVQKLTNAHMLNLSNPHAVTASQVGAYTKEEADALIDGARSLVPNFASSVEELEESGGQRKGLCAAGRVYLWVYGQDAEDFHRCFERCRFSGKQENKFVECNCRFCRI